VSWAASRLPCALPLQRAPGFPSSVPRAHRVLGERPSPGRGYLRCSSAGRTARGRAADAGSFAISRRDSVLLRYWLFKVPELLALASAATGLAWYGVLAWYWGAAAVVAYVLKDAALYPWLRRGYRSEPSAMVGPERLLGSLGVATEELAPSGFVRVSGELWRADTADGARLAKGTPVCVLSVHGLRVVVAEARDRSPRS
jgi:membrane protein implicated in regulation of membrane protease activity